MMLNDEQFLNQANLIQLLVVYANAKPTSGGFVVVSDYRESKFATIPLNQNIYMQNNQLLNNYFGLPFSLNGHKHELFISSSLTTFDFFETLFNQIQNLKQRIPNDTFLDMVLICFFGLRGSIDFSRKYYTVDLLDDVVNLNPEYISRLKIWTNDLVLNINDRHNQPQYKQGIERNTQFRIPLRVVFDRVGHDIQQINLYKNDILENNQMSF